MSAYEFNVSRSEPKGIGHRLDHGVICFPVDGPSANTDAQEVVERSANRFDRSSGPDINADNDERFVHNPSLARRFDR